MAIPALTTGSVWRLHAHGREIARLTVTDTDMPWVFATIEALPGFEEFRPLFDETNRYSEAEDWEAADDGYFRINESISMTMPDGAPVVEFLLNIHDDGTVGWRWMDETLDPD